MKSKIGMAIAVAAFGITAIGFSNRAEAIPYVCAVGKYYDEGTNCDCPAGTRLEKIINQYAGPPAHSTRGFKCVRLTGTFRDKFLMDMIILNRIGPLTLFDDPDHHDWIFELQLGQKVVHVRMTRSQAQEMIRVLQRGPSDSDRRR